MISGIGTDLVEISRIQRSLEKGNGFKEKVFSEAEITYCESKGKPYESYAGRFAAKEAFFKALGTGWAGELAFNEVSVMADPQGKPTLDLIGKSKQILDSNSCRLHVSISHTQKYATAFVIIEKLPTNDNT